MEENNNYQESEKLHYNNSSEQVGEPKYAKVMSLGNWLITLFILAIPIINIVMLIIWAVSSTNASKRNFAIAYLIFMVIAVIICSIFYSLLFAVIIGSGVLNYI